MTWNQIYSEAFAAQGIEPNILHAPSDVIAAYWPHAQGSLRGDKIHSVVFDNSKIKRLVPDFRCEVSWAEGVRRAIAWYQVHPAYQTIDANLERAMDEIVQAMGRAVPYA